MKKSVRELIKQSPPYISGPWVTYRPPQEDCVNGYC